MEQKINLLGGTKHMNEQTELVYKFLSTNYNKLKELEEKEALQQLVTFAQKNNIENWFQVDKELGYYETRVDWFWLVRRLRNNINILRDNV